jgi:hypothetical protein
LLSIVLIFVAFKRAAPLLDACIKAAPRLAESAGIQLLSFNR